MKKLIFLSIICVVEASFASRARVLSLGDSFHLLDPHTAFGNPLDIAALGNFVVLDSGGTTVVDSMTNAEGMVSYGLNDKTRMALAFGHQESMLIDGRQFMNNQAGTTYKLLQNPFEVFYTYNSDFVVQAVSARYSNYQDKINNEREASAMLSYGIQIGAWQLYGKYVLLNSVQAAGGKNFDGNDHFNFAVRYGISSYTLGFDYYRNKIKSQTNLITDERHEIDVIKFGLVDLRAKEDEEFFYGIQVNYVKAVCKVKASADCSDSYTRTTLPLWFGFEVKGASWLTARSFIRQNFIVDQMKDSIGYATDTLNEANGAITEYTAAPNSTEVGAGLGLHFGKLTIDGLLQGFFGGNQNQSIDGNDLLTSVSLTYNY